MTCTVRVDIMYLLHSIAIIMGARRCVLLQIGHSMQAQHRFSLVVGIPES